LKYVGADWYASQIKSHLFVDVPKEHVSEVGVVSLLCSTAKLADEATVKSRVNPLPAVSAIEFEELTIPITKSLAFNPVTPDARAGVVPPPETL